MQELLNKYIANGFSDFAGLDIVGVIPIKQEIINQLIAEILQAGVQPASPPQPEAQPAVPGADVPAAPAAPAAPAQPGIDISDLLKLVKRVEVQAADGRLIVRFQIAV